ncbi:ESCRT-II subunit protein VPS25 Ecym_7165 [Eremothecium cymbalariae DBVPG|uniref:ESCRT-II complex subunit VPS25 n=1 Tax=Eremothecium cymbalariae (strain CBS 270.75 / DBVPG 7215 / KCTC 17166 / NRRL Y-17582) TaxID=931890 RepID=G8JVZ8_ERECY|nr:hypothetical protein Ecym_7165 [Eremothecium cymbalariae DBVPG\
MSSCNGAKCDLITLPMPFPPIYDFPPLYTRQPNSLIRKQQLETWVNILIQHARENKGWLISHDGKLLEPKQDHSLFVNENIQRQVPDPFIDEIWVYALQKGTVLKHTNDSFYILWKSLDSWSSLLLQWFETTGKLNQVVTIYEIVSGDDSSAWEFYSMNEQICELALSKLVDRGRATMITNDGKVVAVKVV